MQGLPCVAFSNFEALCEEASEAGACSIVVVQSVCIR